MNESSLINNNLGTHIFLIELTIRGSSYRSSCGKVMIFHVDIGAVLSSIHHMRYWSTCVRLYPVCHRSAHYPNKK